MRLVMVKACFEAEGDEAHRCPFFDMGYTSCDHDQAPSHAPGGDTTIPGVRSSPPWEFPTPSWCPLLGQTLVVCHAGRPSGEQEESGG